MSSDSRMRPRISRTMRFLSIFSTGALSFAADHAARVAPHVPKSIAHMDDLDAAVAYPVLGRGGGLITRLRWPLGDHLHPRRISHLRGQDLLDALRARAGQRIVVTKRKRPYRLVVGVALDEHTTRNLLERCADGMESLAVAGIERCACGREELGRDNRDPGLRSVLLDAHPSARLLVRE